MGTSNVTDINLDNFWSYSCLTVELKGTRASCSALSNACSASNEVATYTAIAGKITSGQSMSMPIIAPLLPKLTLSRLFRICSS